ncbi:TPA: DUF2543 family protein, partial [Raoultella ornithinolytica]|nr:DUF2543 family protein [Raoultella ornithinolytica]
EEAEREPLPAYSRLLIARLVSHDETSEHAQKEIA